MHEVQAVHRYVVEESYDQVIEKRLLGTHFSIQVAGLKAEDLEKESRVTSGKTRALTRALSGEALEWAQGNTTGCEHTQGANLHSCVAFLWILCAKSKKKGHMERDIP